MSGIFPTSLLLQRYNGWTEPIAPSVKSWYKCCESCGTSAKIKGPDEIDEPAVCPMCGRMSVYATYGKPKKTH